MVNALRYVREPGASDKLKKRRRVIVVYALCWAFGMVLLGHWWGGVASADAQNSKHIVHSGETLWSIASSHVKGVNPSDAVDEIMSANGLKDARIYPGEVLVIPVH